MTNREKEQFCAFAAALFTPPDEATIDDLLRDGFDSLAEECARRWTAERPPWAPLIPAADRAGFPSVLQREYARLFGEWEERISLVESTYKRWTEDPGCRMVFAASKGLILGDRALHMRELYRLASLDIPEEFRSMPDHLVLELEFLGLLYRHAKEEQIDRFVGDHLDWIPELKEAVLKADPHPFYRGAVELLQLFLQNETNGVRGKDHGEKRVS